MEGALIEPLSVGFHAANQGDVQVGESVLILGDGTIGMTTLLSCKAHGAGTIIVADLIDAKLDLTRNMGADVAINSDKENLYEKVMQITRGKGVQKVFETAGSPVTIAETPFMAARGGTIIFVGISTQQEINFNFAQIMDKEVTIKSVFRYRNIYPYAIAAVAKGAIDVKKLVTHVFDFDQIQDAYQEALHNKTDALKVMIKVK